MNRALDVPSLADRHGGVARGRSAAEEDVHDVDAAVQQHDDVAGVAEIDLARLVEDDLASVVDEAACLFLGDRQAQPLQVLEHGGKRVAGGRGVGAGAVVVGTLLSIIWSNDESTLFIVAASSGWPVSWTKSTDVNAPSGVLATTSTMRDAVPPQS